MAIDVKDTTVERRDNLDDGYPEKAAWAASPEHLHVAMKAGLNQEDAEFLHSISVEEQNKIFHKVDWRLCPMLAVLYLISHLDRANIGYVNACYLALAKLITTQQCKDRGTRKNASHEGQ